MEKKRWVAVAIAAGLFALSAITSFTASRVTKDEEEKPATSNISTWLYGSGDLTENVIEPGDASKRIVRLQVAGTIEDTGESGLFSTDTYNHQTFMQELKNIKNDPTIKGILLEVNSPGGSTYESAEIATQLQEIKNDKKIPIYVAMKNQAASGAYYISAGADKIFADSETVTGSIGVILHNSNYSELMEKLGIDDTTVKSGALKDIGSSSRPVTEEDQKVLQDYIDSSYKRFVTVVAKGRGMSEEEVRKLADGRIYDGQQALENHLIDAIGYPDDALSALRKDKKLKDAEFIEYTADATGFVNTWLGSKLSFLQGESDTSAMVKLVERLSSDDAPRAMYLYGGE